MIRCTRSSHFSFANVKCNANFGLADVCAHRRRQRRDVNALAADRNVNHTQQHSRRLIIDINSAERRRYIFIFYFSPCILLWQRPRETRRKKWHKTNNIHDKCKEHLHFLPIHVTGVQRAYNLMQLTCILWFSFIIIFCYLFFVSKLV